MIITATVVISSSGAIRIVRKEARPKKGEIVATLELDVPESAFQPPALTLRATVAGAKPEPVLPSTRQATKGNGQTVIDLSEWTAVRIRRLMALLGIDAEALARQLGVSLTLVRGWEQAGGAINLSDTARTKLAELEAQAKGVTS